MSYLICDKCKEYFKLQTGESSKDFECCQCGGELFKFDLKADTWFSKSDIKNYTTGLIKAMKFEDKKFRSSSPIYLGRIGDEKSYEHLLVAMDDDDPKVRAYSIVVLGKLKNKEASEKICQKMKDKSHKVRKSVIRALELIGGQEAFQIIIKGLNDNHFAVRRRLQFHWVELGMRRLMNIFW